MAKYLLLNLAFLLPIGVALYFVKPRKRLIYIVATLLLLTASFDPLIIWLDIVRYHPENILGFTVFGAPIEDFAYAVAAAILLPFLWQRLQRSFR